MQNCHFWRESEYNEQNYIIQQYLIYRYADVAWPQMTLWHDLADLEETWDQRMIDTKLLVVYYRQADAAWPGYDRRAETDRYKVGRNIAADPRTTEDPA